MSPYILCKVLSLQTQITEKVFSTSGSILLGKLFVLYNLSIFRTNISYHSVAVSETEMLMLMSQKM